MDLTFTRGVRPGLRRGFLISAAAVCLAGLLVLVSCGDDDDNNASVAAGTTKPMNGYLLAQGADGILTCVSEDWNIVENMDGTVSAVSRVGAVNFVIAGYKAENVNEGRAGAEILALAYSTVDSDGGGRRNPGVVYLRKTSDPEGWAGLWIGKHNQPRDGSGEVAACPYIMVPDPDDMPAGDCPADIDGMLGDTCYRTDAAGFVDPASPVERGGAVR